MILDWYGSHNARYVKRIKKKFLFIGSYTFTNGSNNSKI